MVLCSQYRRWKRPNGIKALRCSAIWIWLQRSLAPLHIGVPVRSTQRAAPSATGNTACVRFVSGLLHLCDSSRMTARHAPPPGRKRSASRLPLKTSKVVMTTLTSPSNFFTFMSPRTTEPFMSITLLPWRVTLPLTMAVVGGPTSAPPLRPTA